MILRNAMTCLFGIGSILLVADSCAASPFPGARAAARPRRRLRAHRARRRRARAHVHARRRDLRARPARHPTTRCAISNHTGRRIEAVVSVDGRDAIDGKPADWRSKRGYLVPAWGSVDIEGWRISHAQAAAFRFSSVPDSYAARTGSARDVGVIGVAVFPERYLPPRVYRVPPPYRPYSYPYPRPYDEEYRRGGDADSGSAPRAKQRRRRRAKPPRRRRRRARAAARRRRRGGSGAYGKGVAVEAQPYAQRNRPGLGTEYGEAVSSPIYEVEFVRANASRRAWSGRALQRSAKDWSRWGSPVDSYYDQTCTRTRTTTAICAARPIRSP